MSEKRQVTQSVVIETSPELAFEAVTKASELREWFSDQAWTEAKVGGRFEVRWNQGYRSEGKFTKLDPPRFAAATWHGTGEPGETLVEFRLEANEDGVEVTVVHSGIGPGKEWDAALEQSQKGWGAGVENLKSTLETGVDLRIARQPFLGINLDILTAERAKSEGIDAENGIYVLGTVDDSGARAAGLEQGDVIVSLSGVATPGYEELGAALRAHHAGDRVDMGLVRGQEREILKVTLGQRPQVTVPGSAAELADGLAEAHKGASDELVAALEGVTDEEASQSPAEGEWSAKQTLAHLSTSERGFHNLLVNWAVNGWLDGEPVYPDQIPGQLEAAITVTPTVQGLLDRYLTDVTETVALMRYLPQETLAHKARFRRIAEVVQYGPDHTRDHTAQIKAAIEAVRNPG